MINASTPSRPVEKKPAELDAVLASDWVFGSPFATRISFSRASVNHPPCVVMSKIFWPGGMYVEP